MDTRRWEYFTDLAETGNYSETAERMFTTQSTVSKQILALEKDIQVTLFDRSHRRICLTDAGKNILPEVKKLLAMESEIEKKLREYSHSERQSVKIHGIPVLPRYGVLELLSDFGRKFPDIRVIISEVEKSDIVDNLEAGRCDVAFTRIFEDDAGFDTFTVDTDNFAAVMQSGDEEEASASKKNKPGTLKWEELKGKPLIVPDEKTELFDAVLNLCRDAGFEPEVTYKGVRIETILSMVANGMGTAILMEKTVPDDRLSGLKRVKLLPPEGKEKKAESRLVFAKKREGRMTKASKTFWEYLHKKSD